MASIMMKAIFLIAIAMVILVGLSSVSINITPKSAPIDQDNNHGPTTTLLSRPKTRVSRFLVETRYLNERRIAKAADHCNKDNEICNLVYGNSYNTTIKCCNNKCMDLSGDAHNCGACHNKCKFTQQCCGGECVDMAFDKRHCGSCNNKCLAHQYCVYGMCNYA